MAHRAQKLNSLLHETLATIIERELDYPNVLVTVISVTATKDLEQCAVHLAILPHKAAEKTLQKIRSAKGLIRHYLSEKLDLRITPDLVFTLDQGTLNAERVEILFDQDKNERGS